MARSFGKILTSIWRDRDFLARSTDAKLLYVHLVTREDISFAGRLVTRERVWAREALQGDLDVFTKAFAELVDHDYVLVDDDYQETLVRTFIRHDEAYKHTKWRKTVASAISEIDSPQLREVASTALDQLVDNPDGDDPEPQPERNGLPNGTRPDGKAPSVQCSESKEQRTPPTTQSAHTAPEPKTRAQQIAERAGELHGIDQVNNHDGRDRLALGASMTRRLLDTQHTMLNELAERDDLDLDYLARRALTGQRLPPREQPQPEPEPRPAHDPGPPVQNTGNYRAILAQELKHPERFLRAVPDEPATEGPAA